MHIESFIDYLRYERNFSSHTVAAYENDLRQFATYIVKNSNDDGNVLNGESFDDIDVANVNAEIVRSWLVELMDMRLSAASVNRKLSALQTFFTYLVRQGVVAIHPLKLLNGPKKAKTLPCFIKEKDMNETLDEKAFEENFIGVRDRLMLEMFYETGIRRSELTGIKNPDVDMEAMLLKVTGKRNKQRLIPFANRLKTMIAHYNNVRAREVGSESPYFFVRENGQPVTTNIVYNMVKKRLSGIPALSRRSPHVLRHTFATSMLNDGADISAVRNLLGHSSLASTSVYTHVTFEEMKKVYNAHPRAQK